MEEHKTYTCALCGAGRTPPSTIISISPPRSFPRYSGVELELDGGEDGSEPPF